MELWIAGVLCGVFSGCTAGIGYCLGYHHALNYAARKLDEFKTDRR